MTTLTTIGKRVAFAMLLSGALAGAVWGVGLAREPEAPPAQKKSEQPVETSKIAPIAEADLRRDLFNDPLPKGAELRLGTIGFRVPNVAGVGFRPTGELVGLTENLMLYVWPADGTPKPKVSAVTGKPQFGWRRSLSPNARFAAAHVDRKIVVWDVSGDKPVEYLSREAQDIYTMCFSANGNWLAVNVTEPRDKAAVLLCDLAKKTWGEVPFAGGYVHALSFAADGKSLAVVTGRGVSVIDTATRAERLRKEISKVHPWFAAISPDGKTLAVLPVGFIHRPTPTVIFFSVASGEEIAGVKAPSVSASWLGYSRGGKTILLGGPHGIREWEPTAGKWVREIVGPASKPAVYSADGRRLAAHSGNAVLIWDAEKQRHVHPDLIDGGHTEAIMGIAVSPDGKLIATDALDGDIRMWAADTGRPLFRVASTWSSGRRVEFLPDSKSFVAVADDYVTPVLRDAMTGRELRRFTVPPDAAKKETSHDLRLSADGKTLTTTARPVIAHEKSYAVRWDIGTGRQVERTERANDLNDLIFSPNISPDEKWSVKRGALSPVGSKESIQLVDPQESMMMPASFSRNSRLVAVSRSPQTAERESGSLVVYSIAAKTQVAELATGRALRQAFSPDGSELAVVGDKETTLWDLQSAKVVRRFPIPAGNMLRERAIAFTPDGRRLITGHDDCTALVWDLTGTGRAAGAAAPRLSADDLAKMWDALAGNDAAKAHTAAWELTDRGQQTLAFIRERLKPVKEADKAVVGRLVATLDAAGFADREAAAKSLRDLGDPAIPALRAALKLGLSAEAAGRVERLLAAAAAPVISNGSGAQHARAIAVLRRIGSDDARKLLTELVGGLAEARLTREATEALQSLPRPAPEPK